MSTTLPELTFAAIASRWATSLGGPNGLHVFGVGKLTYSPLFDNGVTVPMSEDECATAASRSIKRGGTTVSEFRSRTSPCLTQLSAVLILPTNPRLCSLTMSSMHELAAI